MDPEKVRQRIDEAQQYEDAHRERLAKVITGVAAKKISRGFIDIPMPTASRLGNTLRTIIPFYIGGLRANSERNKDVVGRVESNLAEMGIEAKAYTSEISHSTKLMDYHLDYRLRIFGAIPVEAEVVVEPDQLT